ncbi:lymphocyte antigen 6E-like [Varanus komodoensis]|uniref:UPAR/Ly6 domain-containing protein n=1 Tax=Varanus komodoensis TaxID=61221 RepID=A0A8D2LQ70_VARKO|nr:lymphocyte antigen 6E-like [Varanus komodoensis]
MKASLAIVLASCLCVQRAFSLVCWSCEGAESNWGCWRWQICSNSDNYCATTYIGASLGGYSKQSISKGCVPICPASGVNIGIMAASVNCCSSFLCNISGASSVKSNQLVLAAGMLASLLYLFGPRL